MQKLNLTLNISALAILVLINTTSFAATKIASLTDGEIIGIYNQVNSFDVEMALLATTQSSSDKVIQLAKSVSNDHRSVRIQAAELAETQSIVVSIPEIRQAAALQFYKASVKLSAMKGAEFDRAYLLHEIKFHTNAMKAVKNTLLPASQDKVLKQHFQTVLPHFQHHLQQTINVAQELGYYQYQEK
ncbi:MAG: DUF4142 domain-containing protein [Methylococcales bacterium]